MDKNIPEIEKLQSRRPFLWLNPYLHPAEESLHGLPLQMKHIEEAEARLRRFAPLLELPFGELRPSGGIIESELFPVPEMVLNLSDQFNTPLRGKMLVKADHALPVAGSIKARGGIYEVLCFAETIAMERGLPGMGEPDSIPDTAHHIVWTTGGSFVPPEEFARFRDYDRSLCRR